VNQKAQLIAAEIVEGNWKVAKGCLEDKQTTNAQRG